MFYIFFVFASLLNVHHVWGPEQRLCQLMDSEGECAAPTVSNALGQLRDLSDSELSANSYLNMLRLHFYLRYCTPTSHFPCPLLLI